MYCLQSRLTDGGDIVVVAGALRQVTSAVSSGLTYTGDSTVVDPGLL